MPKLTPMLQQYLETKQEYSDCILFFRLGDFYEMFFEDAVVASRELEIVLTSRESGADRIPMCGIPYHAATGYLARLLQKGFKVAICEQVEDPKQAKGIVRREVVRVITPGTVIEDQLLTEKSNNYLAALALHDGFIGLAYVDLSTGEYLATQVSKNMTALVFAELTRIKPAEIVLAKENIPFPLTELKIVCPTLTFGQTDDFDYRRAYRNLIDHFQTQSLTGYGCEDLEAAVCAAGAILAYLQETQKSSPTHLRKLSTYQVGEFMALDAATRRNLELTKTIRGGEAAGSLLGVLDLTVSSMGGRMLRTWIEQPLTQLGPIRKRQDAVGELKTSLEKREEIRETLTKTYDLQRILGKLASNTGNARDLLALKKTLDIIPGMCAILQNFKTAKLVELNRILNPEEDLTGLLEKALRDDPPLTIKDGGMIKATYHEELGKLLSAGSKGRQWVADLEQKERERTGIKSLKVGFNQVFGYYIEVTNANLNAIPGDYIRKQTLTNGERFINQALKEYEDVILNAHQKSITLEYQIFMDLRDAVLQRIDSLQATAFALAELDALTSLAEAAVRYHYVRPELNEEGKLLIIDGRHPVVEQMLEAGSFVPNDTLLDLSDNRTLIITGPNMAGKSTYMRQVALIVLMAHIGGYIPAKSANISLVDRIFTRVGASDDLATGQSTFMVEMNEVAYILNHATNRSLLIMDEIGRGTSTFDGLSIAWAVIEFVNNPNRIAAKTLVATHYHELTELEEKLEGVKNYHIAVQRDGEEIIFLRKIKTGMASQSYGIEVARLAGLPTEITERAREILKVLEQNENNEFHKIQHPPAEPPGLQLSLFPMEKEIILDELRNVDLASTTPLQALNHLYGWQQKLRQNQSIG